MSMEAFRSGSLRGEVGLKWEHSGRPNWDLAQTIRETVAADQMLETVMSNPAPVFRKARIRADREYLERWVLGCKFPFLNPR